MPQATKRSFFRSALLASLPAALGAGLVLAPSPPQAGERETAFVKDIYEKMRQNFRDPGAPMYLPFREHASAALKRLVREAQATCEEGEPLFAYDFFMQGNNWDPSEKLSFAEAGPAGVRVSFAGTKEHPRPKGAWVEFELSCRGGSCVVEDIRDPEVGSLAGFLKDMVKACPRDTKPRNLAV